MGIACAKPAVDADSQGAAASKAISKSEISMAEATAHDTIKNANGVGTEIEAHAQKPIAVQQVKIDLDTSKQCTVCGNTQRSQATFCTRCGSSFVAKTSAQ